MAVNVDILQINKQCTAQQNFCFSTDQKITSSKGQGPIFFKTVWQFVTCRILDVLNTKREKREITVFPLCGLCHQSCSQCLCSVGVGGCDKLSHPQTGEMLPLEMFMKFINIYSIVKMLQGKLITVSKFSSNIL